MPNAIRRIELASKKSGYSIAEYPLAKDIATTYSWGIYRFARSIINASCRGYPAFVREFVSERLLFLAGAVLFKSDAMAPEELYLAFYYERTAPVSFNLGGRLSSTALVLSIFSSSSITCGDRGDADLEDNKGTNLLCTRPALPCSYSEASGLLDYEDIC